MEILSSKFEVLSNIGDGSFGNVVLARRKVCNDSEPRLVAIKTMKKTFQTFSDCLKLREIQSLRTLPPHPHIVPVYDTFLDPTTKRLHLVMEYMEGNLYQLIKSRNRKSFDIQTIQHILYQTLSALKHIHDHNFFHRDIKPENILVSTVPSQRLSELSTLNNKFLTSSSKDVTYLIKLGDFGLAREIESQSPYTSYVSTRWYRAPEVLLRANEYSAPVDIWAFGAMAAELATFRPLFPGTNEIDQIWRICEVIGSPAIWIHSNNNTEIGGGEWKKGLKLAEKLGFSFPKIPPMSLETILSNSWPSSFASFIRWTIQWDPLRRPNCIQSLEHPFFNKIDNSIKVSIIKMNIKSEPVSSQLIDKKLSIDQHNFYLNKTESHTHKKQIPNEKCSNIHSMPQKHLSFNLKYLWFRKKYEAADLRESKYNKDIQSDNHLEIDVNSGKFHSKHHWRNLVWKSKIANSDLVTEPIASEKAIDELVQMSGESSLHKENDASIKPLVVNENESKLATKKIDQFNSTILDIESSAVDTLEKNIGPSMSLFSHLRKKNKQLEISKFKDLYNSKSTDYSISNGQDSVVLHTFQSSDKTSKTFNAELNKKHTQEIAQPFQDVFTFTKDSYSSMHQNKMLCSTNHRHHIVNGSTLSQIKDFKFSSSSNSNVLYGHKKNEDKFTENSLNLSYDVSKKADTIRGIKKNKNCYMCHPYGLKNEKTERDISTDSKNKLLLRRASQPFHSSRLYFNFNVMHHKPILSASDEKYPLKYENITKQNISIRKKKPLVVY
ncbi:hypothetical protein T552_00307 [Pneumocystis carinii B80]|uniref:Protein kinase domain-containing protein n=1 Tax=Pneumocystis carinii (strain B80) TaxID=1408658 RepID=A0A0W4ZQD8_PNEC8|nr:hypothetical protein T552_00307 [Pneumocystis carinii B80]KTW30590.1 hypothetical protein T552_00307 [Pneumocystis carinii B80]